MREETANRRILLQVAREIEPLLAEVVFVGGQTADLLVTSPGVTRIRPTKDVDVVVEVTSRTSYARLEQRLLSLGLTPDAGENAIICRWITPSRNVLDLLPTDPRILGFSNRWYSVVVETAVPYQLAHDLAIRVPTAPLFLATKWEAFLRRGEGDVLGSHDLEDVITVIAGRHSIVEEMIGAPAEVRRWMAEELGTFLESQDAEYAVQGALPDASQIPGLIPRMLDRIRSLAEMA